MGSGLVGPRTTNARAQVSPGTAPPTTWTITTISDKGYGFIGRDAKCERGDHLTHPSGRSA